MRKKFRCCALFCLTPEKMSSMLVTSVNIHPNPKGGVMTSEEIRMELFKRRKQVTMSSIARELGVSHVSVINVINKTAISNRIMEAVARAIGKDKEYVFPEYFLKKAS